jgi:hypothetical protein
VPGGLEPVALDVGSEPAELLGVPEPHLGGGGGPGPRRPGSVGRVVGQEPGIDGVAQDLVERGVDVPDRLDVEAASSALLLVSSCHQVDVEAVEQRRVELVERPVAEDGQHVESEHPVVAGPGGGLDLTLHGWEPATQDPFFERDLRRFGVDAGVDLVDKLGPCRFGFSAHAEAAVPFLAPAAGRIPAELENDVPRRRGAPIGQGMDALMDVSLHRRLDPLRRRWRCRASRAGEVLG